METSANSFDVNLAAKHQFAGLNRDLGVGCSRLTVCHIASGDAWGGAEAQVTTLVGALSKRPDLDVCAIVLNEGRLTDQLMACGILVKILPQKQKSFLEIVADAHDFVRQQNVRIIHSHRYKENLIAALLALRDPNLRLVRTQHGWPEAAHGLSGIKQWIAHALDRLTARYSADCVISVSDQLNHYLRRHVTPRKIATICNGIDLKQVHCELSKAEAKAQLGIRETDLVVGFAGRLERVKRLDLFAAAAGEISARLPNVKFVIAGSGREEQALRKTIYDDGLAEKTLLLGHCDNSYDVLRAMDLLLITSDHEGLPMVMLEAMALGTVVVSRPVGGIPEVLRDNQTGILLKTADANDIAEICSNLLLDVEKRSRIADAARELVERQYSDERNCDQVVSLYYSLQGIERSLHKGAEERCGKRSGSSSCAVPVIRATSFEKDPG